MPATPGVAVYLPTAAVYPSGATASTTRSFGRRRAAGLPVMLHSVSAVAPVIPFNIEQFDTALARHTISHCF